MEDKHGAFFREFYELNTRLMQRISHDVSNILGKGMTISQYAVMWYVGSAPSASVSHLSEFMGVTRSAITSLCDRLETAGFLRREHDTQDRRVVHLALTETGLRKLTEVETLQMEILYRYLGRLPTEDLARLREIMRKLADVLDDGRLP